MTSVPTMADQHNAEKQDTADTKLDSIHIEHVARSRELDLSIWETLKENPMVIICCLFANCGALMYGYDNLALSLCLSMVPFQMQFGHPVPTPTGTMYLIPAYWQSLWNALAQVATMIGSFAVAPVIDRFGRRAGFLLASIFSVVGVAVVFIASSPGVFLAGKMINGLGLGMAVSTGQTYVSEIAPLRIRGLALSVYTICVNIGFLIAASIALNRVDMMTNASYKVLFASEWCWPCVLFLGCFFIPESPYFLLRKEKLDEAAKALERLRNSKIDTSVLLQDMQALIVSERHAASIGKDTSWRECFQGTNWRRTRIILYAQGLPQMIGSSFLANGPYFLISAGMTPLRTATVVEIGLALGVLSAIVTSVFMGKFGRRPICLFGTGIAVVLFLIMGISSCFKTSAALWVIGVSLELLPIAIGPSISPSLVIAGEISEMRLRGKSQSIGFVFSFFLSTVFSVVIPYMFNTDQGNLGGKMGWIFMALSIVAVVVLWLELPETKDRSSSAIDELFQKKVPARKFADFEVETQLVD